MANVKAYKNTTQRFSKDNQPQKRGRPKSVFGPLAKENNLSLDDIRKVYKNILTSRLEDLDAIVEKYPTAFTAATIGVFKQEMLGVLSGKKSAVKTGKLITDDTGEPVEETQLVEERVKSYRMVEYMLDRIFGTPIQSVDITETIHDIPEDPEARQAYIKTLDDTLVALEKRWD
jgi:hypothetical protein